MRRAFFAMCCVTLLALGATSCEPAPPPGSVIGPIDFESPRYSTGAVDGQDGWRSAGSLDHEIDDESASGGRAEDWGFGDQALRVSNAVVGEGATDQTVSRPTEDHSGEVTEGDVNGVRRGFFETSWSFATAGDPQVEQEDLAVVASPDRGDGSPMSRVQMADCSAEDNATPAFCLADGLEVNVFEYDTDAGAMVGRNVATGLSRSQPHTVRVRMFFFDGPGNDVVEVCVDATQCRAVGSLEDLHRAGPDAETRAVDSVTFGADGPAVPEHAGAGFFIDGFVAKAVGGSGAAVAVSGPASVTEGDTGDTVARYTITLSQPLPITVAVQYSTADGSAVEPDDYEATSGTVSFAPGQTAKTVSVPVHGDLDDEVPEQFSFVLRQPVTSGRGPGAASGDHVGLRSATKRTTVADDDSTIRIADVTADEPARGNKSLSFTVSLDNPSVRPVTVRFSTEDRSATAPDDYTAVTDALVTVEPGETSHDVPVTIKGDGSDEEEERFKGLLDQATGGEIATADADAFIRNTNPGPRPNIVMVMTDDQTVEMMRFLTRTKALLGDEGTTFTNSFVNFPLCCPSRATYLTGQYSHNHGVRSNDAPEGGYHRLDHTNALPVWLEDSGYTTAHIGKYLHGYGVNNPTERPPGYTEWYGLIDFTTYQVYDYKMNRNGVVTQYGHAPEDYQTDVLADTAVDVIRRRAPSSRPFYLSVAPLAPHLEGSTPIRPAPRHQGDFSSVPLPRPPNFDEADVGDKPSYIRNRPRLTAAQITTMTTAYRRAAESLLAVDEMVERMYGALEDAGELDDTVFVFTSDNAYFYGEHRVTGGKGRVYDEAVKVPLIVRGPGFEPGVTVTAPVINADLAPTFTDMSGAVPRRVMDGRSLLDRDPGRPLLFESENTATTFTAVRTPAWEWVEYPNGQRELYDVKRDPYQLTSRHADPRLAAVRTKLAVLLDALRTCAGATCRPRG